MQIKSLEQLAQAKKDSLCKTCLRKSCEDSVYDFSDHQGVTDGDVEYNVIVCGGTACLSSASEKVFKNFSLLIKAKGLEGKVKLIKTGCFGFCEQGPIVKIQPDNVFYVQVGPKDVKDIIDEHLIGGNIVDRLLYTEPDTKQRLQKHEDIPFYKKQHRVALRNCGLIDPQDIYEYISLGGYEALGIALTKMTPEEVIEVVKASGLRGRGGGGFPTGIKWDVTRKSQGDKKYVICNADEGDPGAFMDRSILEGDPQSIIEAMAIAAYSIGASYGLIYIRAEYPLAIERLKIAIDQARETGFLGKGIFGTDFEFDIQFKYGAGAFVCGEETALINSCEGRRGEPSYKPPYPAQEGYWGYPTCVNNVETFANIPIIITKGAEWFASVGTEKSRGTKVFALAGKINNVGLVEVPMGITLREIIYDIGGGIKDGHKFKAVQTGGPSGGVITEKYLDTPIDYESLISISSMMGSGGMIVMDETDNMVEIAKFFLEFTMDESCGRCTPCRVGTKRLYELLCKITKGDATQHDIDILRQLAYTVKDGSLCGLGQTAPNPIISTLTHFEEEYLAFIKDDSSKNRKEKEVMQNG